METTQLTLFKEKRLRRSNGRYCTKEQYLIERVYEENILLRLERDKYYRAWMSSSQKASRIQREYEQLQNKIKETQNGQE